MLFFIDEQTEAERNQDEAIHSTKITEMEGFRIWSQAVWPKSPHSTTQLHCFSTKVIASSHVLLEIAHGLYYKFIKIWVIYFILNYQRHNQYFEWETRMQIIELKMGDLNNKIEREL